MNMTVCPDLYITLCYLIILYIIFTTHTYVIILWLHTHNISITIILDICVCVCTVFTNFNAISWIYMCAYVRSVFTKIIINTVYIFIYVSTFFLGIKKIAYMRLCSLFGSGTSPGQVIGLGVGPLRIWTGSARSHRFSGRRKWRRTRFFRAELGKLDNHRNIIAL